MKDLPTILVRGYDVDLSWVSFVKSALTETYNQPASPAESPVIKIPGGLEGPEFVVTLKPGVSASNDRMFPVTPDPHGPDGIIIFVPREPIDPLQQRTGWLRKELLETITNSIYRMKRFVESLPPETVRPFPANEQEVTVKICKKVSKPDFAIYFHPNLSQEQVEKSFAALADYYRACGGTGLRVELEEQDIRVPEVAYDGRW